MIYDCQFAADIGASLQIREAPSLPPSPRPLSHKRRALCTCSSAQKILLRLWNATTIQKNVSTTSFVLLNPSSSHDWIELKTVQFQLGLEPHCRSGRITPKETTQVPSGQEAGFHSRCGYCDRQKNLALTGMDSRTSSP
jgi:hypothetical protein